MYSCGKLRACECPGTCACFVFCMRARGVRMQRVLMWLDHAADFAIRRVAQVWWKIKCGGK